MANNIRNKSRVSGPDDYRRIAGGGGYSPKLIEHTQVNHEKKSARTLEQLLSPYLNANEVTARNSAGALKLYRQSSAVSIVINKIARQIKQLRPILMIDDGESVETSGDILDLLDNPSPEWSRSRFMEAVSVNFLATDVAYIWCGGNVNQPPIEMVPINSDQLTVNETADDIPESYRISMGPYKGIFKRVEQRVRGKRVVRYLNGNMSELLIIRGTDTESAAGLTPQSKLQSIQDEINQVLKANKHNLSMLANGGRLSLLFTLKGSGQEEFEQAQQSIMDKYQGASAAGSIAVVAAEDAGVQEFGITPKDMDFEAMQKTAILRVAQEYDIPGVLVLNDSATFNNMDTAREMMFDDAIFPVVSSIYEALEDFLVMRFKREDQNIDLRFDESRVPALRTRRFNEIKVRREANIETINELRSDIGLDPYGEGGDKIYQNGTLIAVGDPDVSDPRRDIVKPRDDG